MTAKQVGDWLGLSERTIFRFSEEGIIPSLRLGRSLRFDPRDVETYLAEQRRVVG